MSGNAVDLCTWHERKDLLLWLVQWATENQEKRSLGAFDIMELVQLLQCAGFRLQKFESSPNLQPSSHITLQLTCGRSCMTATMSATPFLPCNCGTSKEMEALALNKKLDSIKQAMTIDILKELIYMISHSDKNDNNEKAGARTWEVDPNTTPPRDSSSPMPSHNKDIIIKQNVKQIVTIATSTLELLNAENRVENTTFTKDSNKALKRVSDIIPVATVPHCDTPSVTKKPQTPVPSSIYKNISSKVDTFRQKSSPSLNVGKPNGAAKKTEKSKIPGIMQPRFGSKRGEPLSVKGSIKK